MPIKCKSTMAGPLLGVIAIAFSCSAHAQLLRFLNDSLLSTFDEAERADFRRFVGENLEDLPDGQVAEWRSGSSDLTGKIKPMVTHETAGMKCRRTAFKLMEKGREPETYRFDLCKTDEGWKMMSTPAETFTKEDWEMMTSTGKQALELDTQGEPLTWANEKSKSFGSFVVTQVDKATGCKQLAISMANGEGMTSSGVYRFCKNEAGEWKRDLASEL